MNFLLNVTCLSGSVCTHVTHEASLLDGMDLSVEAVLDSNR